MTVNFEGAREGEFRYKKCILNVEAFFSCLGVTSLHRQGITSLNKCRFSALKLACKIISAVILVYQYLVLFPDDNKAV